MKNVIVYYSHTGNTEETAKLISEKTGFPLIKVEPVKDITKGALRFLTGGAQATMDKRPELKELSFNADEYDGIILGTPVWAGKCAPALMSFLDKFGAAEKVVAVFALSGGGSIAYAEKMKSFLPNLKLTVGIADRSNKAKAGENAGKAERFAEEVKKLSE